MIIWHDLAVNLIWISKRWWKNSTSVNNTSIFGIYCSLWVKVHLFSFISFTVENYIQSQANRNVVSQASQMGDKSHFFNFLNQDIEIFTHSWHTYKEGESFWESHTTHLLFASALKRSCLGTGCSRSYVRSMAGQPLGKPTGNFLPEWDGRYTAFSDPRSPKFCIRHKESTINPLVTDERLLCVCRYESPLKTFWVISIIFIQCGLVQQGTSKKIKCPVSGIICIACMRY